MQSLWNITEDKYNGKEENYDINFEISVAFTNFHIILHPLREIHGKEYHR